MRTLRNTSAAFLLSVLQFAAVLPLRAQVDARFDVANMKTVMVLSRAEVVASSRRNYTQFGACKPEFEANDLPGRLGGRSDARMRRTQNNWPDPHYSRRPVVQICNRMVKKIDQIAATNSESR